MAADQRVFPRLATNSVESAGHDSHVSASRSFFASVFRLAWRDRVLLAVPVCHHEPALLITLIGMQAADHVDPCLSCSERILQRTARISPGYRVSTALGPRHAALQRHSSQLLQPFDGVRGSPITAHGQGRSRAARWPSLSLLS
jgi:hypothetical protein